MLEGFFLVEKIKMIQKMEQTIIELNMMVYIAEQLKNMLIEVTVYDINL